MIYHRWVDHQGMWICLLQYHRHDRVSISMLYLVSMVERMHEAAHSRPALLVIVAALFPYSTKMEHQDQDPGILYGRLSPLRYLLSTANHNGKYENRMVLLHKGRRMCRMG